MIDKSKDIRAAAEKVLEKVHEKLGIEVFRVIAKDQRPAVAKDLNTLLDKYDKNPSTSGLVSKGVSPNRFIEKEQPKPRNSIMQAPPLSGKKKSLEKTTLANNRSFIERE